MTVNVLDPPGTFPVARHGVDHPFVRAHVDGTVRVNHGGRVDPVFLVHTLRTVGPVRRALVVHLFVWSVHGPTVARGAALESRPRGGQLVRCELNQKGGGGRTLSVLRGEMIRAKKTKTNFVQKSFKVDVGQPGATWRRARVRVAPLRQLASKTTRSLAEGAAARKGSVLDSYKLKLWR